MWCVGFCKATGPIHHWLSGLPRSSSWTASCAASHVRMGILVWRPKPPRQPPCQNLASSPLTAPLPRLYSLIRGRPSGPSLSRPHFVNASATSSSVVSVGSPVTYTLVLCLRSNQAELPADAAAAVAAAFAFFSLCAAMAASTFRCCDRQGARNRGVGVCAPQQAGAAEWGPYCGGKGQKRTALVEGGSGRCCVCTQHHSPGRLPPSTPAIRQPDNNSCPPAHMQPALQSRTLHAALCSQLCWRPPLAPPTTSRGAQDVHAWPHASRPFHLGTPQRALQSPFAHTPYAPPSHCPLCLLAHHH